MKKTACPRCDGGSLARRDFIRVGSLGLLGITLGQYLQANKVQASQSPGEIAKRVSKADACILLWLSGGAPQMDTFDPKPTSAFKPISTNVDGIQISELFPRLAKRMDMMSIIRSMKSKETNHPQACVEVMTGHSPTAGLKCPSLSTMICRELGPRTKLPPNLVVPSPFEGAGIFDAYKESYLSGFLDSRYDPIFLPDPSKDKFELPDLTLPQSLSVEQINDRRSFLNVVQRMYRRKEKLAEFAARDEFMDQAISMLLAPTVKAAFDLSKEKDKTKDAYGRHKVGMSALLARRLIEGGARFVTVTGSPKSYADWDTHTNNNESMRDSLGPTLDQTLTVLLDDLKQRGLLESTVVLVMGEFGRTPDINSKAGRDHYPNCWSMLLGGGGIAGGHIIGMSDEKAAHPIERPTSIGDTFATVYKAMGIDHTKSYMTPVGRPIYIANGFEDQLGVPIPELI